MALCLGPKSMLAAACKEVRLACIAESRPPSANIKAIPLFLPQVTPADVTPESLDALVTADYGRYSLVPQSARACIVDAGYAVRDQLLMFAHDLNVFSDCSDFHVTKAHMYIVES